MLIKIGLFISSIADILKLSTAATRSLLTYFGVCRGQQGPPRGQKGYYTVFKEFLGSTKFA